MFAIITVDDRETHDEFEASPPNLGTVVFIKVEVACEGNPGVEMPGALSIVVYRIEARTISGAEICLHHDTNSNGPIFPEMHKPESHIWKYALSVRNDLRDLSMNGRHEMPREFLIHLLSSNF